MIQNYDGHEPKIHESAFVHPDATVIGQAVIKAGATIWPATVLRADMGLIEIGENTSVQDGTIVHLTENWSKTVVGDRVTVGHRVILHGCIVEDDCLIGMGAILLDNAVIGKGSLIGAGALVTANTVIPPGSVVFGSPGKVVRQVGEREKAMIEGGWRTYVEHGAQYKREMKL